MTKKSFKKKRRTAIIIVAVLVVALIVALLSKKNDNAVSVTVERVGRRTITQTVSAVGQIKPETSVNVSSQTSGEIIYLGVEEGDTVKKGQLLVKIKPDIVETQLEQAKAAAEAAKMDIEVRKAEMNRLKNTLERSTKLFEKEFISREDFDKTKSAYRQAVASYKASLSRYSQAMANYKQMQRSAERTVIYSPIDGIVTKLNVEIGEKVVGTEMMQGTEMMVISDMDVMNAEVEADENDIVLVNLLDSADVEIDAFPDKIFKGVVKEIGHSAITSQLGSQDQTTNFKVKIRLLDKEPKLRPGMTCSADIKTETRKNVVAVPLQAVTVRTLNDSASVKDLKKAPSVAFLKKGDRAKMVKVKTGVSDNGYIEIIDGIKEGDTVIKGSYLAITKQLKDGSKIRVKDFGKKYGKRRE